MSIDTGVGVGWLDQLIDDDHKFNCTSDIVHDCTVTARWVAYSDNKCSIVNSKQTFWCDSRYQYWVQVRDKISCICGLNDQRHWNVVPL